MNSKKVKTIVCLVLVVVTALSSMIALVACNKNQTTYDNENDPLVFSTQAVDKVFNPFFSSTGPDSSVVGMTQISMLSNDKSGNVAYGDGEAVVAKDYQSVHQGNEDEGITTYYFVLKNNIRFSNGSYLTIKDVLFNYYVYLDPAYTGSSTIYSTDIVGLKAYRTQSQNPDEQEQFNAQFKIAAAGRISKLKTACNAVFKAHDDADESVETMTSYLEEYAAANSGNENVVADFKKAVELFKEELANDYSNNVDSYKDISFKDEDGNLYKNLFTTDQEAFFYNEGLITWNKKEAKLSVFNDDLAGIKSWSVPKEGENEEQAKERAKQQAIDIVFAEKMPKNVVEIVSYWNTSVTLSEFLEKQAMEEFAKSHTKTVENISGIKFANRTESVVVNGTEYKPVEYDANGNVKEGFNEVLSVAINGVDPKAIWNFAIGIAPMYYYSSSNWHGKDYIGSFNYENEFGVEFMSQSFMNEVVKDPNKVGVPVGAGAYAASKSSGGIDNVASGEFYDKGVIYFERNPYFCMGPAKIKKVRYQVVGSNNITTTLYTGAVDFAEPNAKPETIEEINSHEGYASQSVSTLGYGYIGVNAGKVPSIKVRQAIMHAINTQETVDYYKTTASPIYRSMSRSSWAYPGYNNGEYGTDDPTPYYPYVGGAVPEDLSVVNPDYREFVQNEGLSAGQKMSEEQQRRFITSLVESAGYTINAEGIYQNGSNKLKYTFTIAGEETDHPAFNAMLHAREVLNECGFQITVTTDSNALKKLSTGDLTVWAAAWGSTIDPDMYQVYHKESTATSVLNWGYKQILNDTSGKYAVEQELIDQLSELIESARKTDDKTSRARDYSDALDIVMQLAIELPTYQRKDLFAYNTKKIDASTFTPISELSPFKGLTSELWNVSLVTAK